jgi:2'-hydroxyisoflavone reductase
MRLLVLGGTSFVGRHLVENALAHGHQVTLFHRGRTNPTLFPQAEHRHGDRSPGDYAALAEGTWDATVDVCAYVPRHVEQALGALAGRQGHYVLVSSISAYDHRVATRFEDSPRYPPPDPQTETVDGDTYGPLKAACERAAERLCAPGEVAIVRPTFVVGPHDPTDRFTYWARVMAAGGRVPIAWPDAALQVIDARDLAAFMLTVAASRAAGVFDAAGPSAPLTAFLADLADPDRPFELVDVGAGALQAIGASLPMVDGDPASVPLMTRPADHAVAAGLHTRSLADTARDTVAWDVSRGRPDLRTGLTPQQRSALLG